jgi:lipopolysaccharide biosynthesis protein
VIGGKARPGRGYDCDTSKYICKIHSKKSIHRQDGDKWRQSLIKGLIGTPETIKSNIHRLDSNDSVGIIVPKGNVFAYNFNFACSKQKLNN